MEVSLNVNCHTETYHQVNDQHLLVARRKAGTRTCSSPCSVRDWSLWDVSHLVSEQFSNKCKTLKGLFGIIDKEFVLPFPGILCTWTQSGIYFPRSLTSVERGQSVCRGRKTILPSHPLYGSTQTCYCIRCKEQSPWTFTCSWIQIYRQRKEGFFFYN